MKFVYFILLNVFAALAQAQNAHQTMPDPFSLSRLPEKIDKEEAQRREFFKSLANNNVFLETSKCSFRAYKSKDDGWVFEVLENNKSVAAIKTNQRHSFIQTAMQGGSYSLMQTIDLSTTQLPVTTPVRNRALNVITNASGQIEAVEYTETKRFRSIVKITDELKPIKYECSFRDNEDRPSPASTPAVQRLQSPTRAQ